MQARLSVVFGAVVIAALGCGKPAPKSEPNESPRVDKSTQQSNRLPIAQLSAFADALCACNDKACGAKVLEAMVQWGEEPGHDAKQLPTAEVSAIAQQLKPCMARLALVAPMPKSETPAPQTRPFTATNVIRAARSWMAAAHPDLTLRLVVVSYVDADGALDPEHGTVEFSLAPYRPDQDPTRRIGAPVRASDRRPSCPQMRFTAKGTWVPSMTSLCGEVAPMSPRCDVGEVWKRAIQGGAERKAVAVLTLSRFVKDATWQFQISDPPRGVALTAFYPDNCEVTVERPATAPPAEDKTPLPL